MCSLNPLICISSLNDYCNRRLGSKPYKMVEKAKTLALSPQGQLIIGICLGILTAPLLNRTSNFFTLKALGAKRFTRIQAQNPFAGLPLVLRILFTPLSCIIAPITEEIF